MLRSGADAGSVISLGEIQGCLQSNCFAASLLLPDHYERYYCRRQRKKACFSVTFVHNAKLYV
jgi:hypothetical protein